MIVVDSHCDSIQQVDMRHHRLVNPYNFSSTYPQLQMVALFCSWPGDSVEDCYRRAVRYIGNFYMDMCAESDKVEQVRTYKDIERVLSARKHAALLTIEGGTGIMEGLEVFRDFWAVGVRVFGLAWLTNQLAKSNRLAEDEKDTGLTDYGKEIIKEGNRLGMVFDVSHLSDQSFWDVAILSTKPIVATHSNFRTICGHSRNLTDDMIKEIIRQRGMIGLNLYPGFVADETGRQTVEQYFRHLEHCLNLGGEDNIGFGGDIDGTDGQYPAPLTTERSIHDQLIEYMLVHNYAQPLVEKVAGGNWLNFLKNYLPEA